MILQCAVEIRDGLLRAIPKPQASAENTEVGRFAGSPLTPDTSTIDHMG
jgi:hypothetical protein